MRSVYLGMSKGAPTVRPHTHGHIVVPSRVSPQRVTHLERLPRKRGTTGVRRPLYRSGSTHPPASLRMTETAARPDGHGRQRLVKRPCEMYALFNTALNSKQRGRTCDGTALSGCESLDDGTCRGCSFRVGGGNPDMQRPVNNPSTTRRSDARGHTPTCARK